MEFGVIKTGGRQYRVVAGDILEVGKLPGGPTTKEVMFEEILLYVNGREFLCGTPRVAGITVVAERVGEGRGEKVTIAKFKSKTRYRKQRGHRQPFTRVKIKEFKKVIRPEGGD